MTRAAALFLFLSPGVLFGCSAPPNPCSTLGSVDAFSSSLAGWPFVPYAECRKTPSPAPEGLASSDPCVACVESACGPEVTACLDEQSCACLVDCRSALSLSIDACDANDKCDADPDVGYDAVHACVSAHCAEQCPRLQ